MTKADRARQARLIAIGATPARARAINAAVNAVKAKAITRIATRLAQMDWRDVATVEEWLIGTRKK